MAIGANATAWVPLCPVAERSVEDAIAWFEERWRGGVFVRDELLTLISAA